MKIYYEIGATTQYTRTRKFYGHFPVNSETGYLLSLLLVWYRNMDWEILQYRIPCGINRKPKSREILSIHDTDSNCSIFFDILHRVQKSSCAKFHTDLATAIHFGQTRFWDTWWILKEYLKMQHTLNLLYSGCFADVYRFSGQWDLVVLVSLISP